MIDVFSGGLVYEFTQEPNNYGLVKLEENGDVKLLKDFMSLKSQYDILPEINYRHVANSMKKNAKQIQTRLKTHKFSLPECEPTYNNLDISKGLPKSLAENLIENGVKTSRGKFVPLDNDQLTSTYKILDVNGDAYFADPKIERVIDIMSGKEITRVHHSRGFHNCTYSDLEDSSDESSDYSSFTDESEEPDSIHTLYFKASKFLRHLYKAIADKFSEN